MKKLKLLLCATLVMAMAACSESKKDSSSDNATESSVTEQTIVEKVKEAPKAETYTVNGKEVSVIKGVTTAQEIKDALGEPTYESSTSVQYTWQGDGKTNQTDFRLNIDNGKVDHVETRSMNL